MDIGGDIFYWSMLILLLILSAFFSATETAFSSASRTRLKAMETDAADAALKVMEKNDDLLSTILIGNNIVNIGMASLATVYFVSRFGEGGASISTVVVTLLVLLFGEISPKSIAGDYPERVAMLMTPVIGLLIVLLTPFNRLFGLWKTLLDKVFGSGETHKTTSDEILVMVDEAAQDGGVDRDESELLRSAIEFDDREAQDILTHRVDLEAVALEASREEVSNAFVESRFSRILVYEEDIDNIIGVVHLKDFYREHEKPDFVLRKILTKPYFAPPTMKIDNLLRSMQSCQASIAVITDEYGGTKGIVTIEDIVEELVGEIWDEHDEVVQAFRNVGKDTFMVDGTTDLDEFFRFFELEEPEEESDSATVAGWVMEQLECIPRSGDTFLYENLQVAVTRTQQRRVAQVRVKKFRKQKSEE